MARSNTRSGKNLNRRNNQIAQNGLLYDSDGNTFDLTQWYKDNTVENVHSMAESLHEIKEQLILIRQHLELVTDELIIEDELK